MEEELTEEEHKAIERAIEKAGEISALYFIYFADGKRIDPRIRKKVYELKKILDGIKIKEVV